MGDEAEKILCGEEMLRVVVVGRTCIINKLQATLLVRIDYRGDLQRGRPRQTGPEGTGTAGAQ